MALPPGTRLGLYEITARIGAGGAGEVYRARDTRLNRSVAIKFLSEQLADQSARRRFQQEAQLASALNHPHILTVLEAGELDGRQYLVTEFVDGGTLRDWARAEKRSWRQIVALLAGVADALAAAHQAGMLHRDVKPDNILVTTNGYAKLADFGLAKLADPTDTDVTRSVIVPHTRAGVLVGTIPYMSPEQASGAALDARSDIFSFAVVLYELLTGRRPSEGKTDFELLQAIQHQPSKPLPADLPVALRLAVDKALEKEPADRYQTMRDLVVDLRRVTRTRPEEIEPVAARRPHARQQRQKIAAGAIAALLVVVVMSAWVLSNRPSSGWRNPLDGAVFTRLTDFEGVETDAVISPDGNFVAFLSDQTGSLDVWLLQLASGQFRNLTQGKVDLPSTQVRTLGFTTDGSHVMFMTSGRNADGTVRSPDTSIVPTIGGPTRIFMEGRVDPQWSADNRLLFFSLIQNRDVMYVAERDGANPREVFPVAPNEHNHFMAWSPDGRYVYSVRSTTNMTENDIWRAPAAGGAPERITYHNSWVAYATPLDDRTLLYVASDENNAGTWLYALDLDRRQEHRLSVGIEQYFSIAASAPASGLRRRLVATMSNPTGSLWSIPIGDSVVSESSATPFAVPAAQVSAPGLGPDYVLYLSTRELADSLWKLQGDTTAQLWKASDGAVLAPPGISRDGSRIAISALKQGRATLYVMTADGANPQVVAPTLKVRETPSWSPDGTALAVTGSDGNGPGLFLVPLDGSPPRRLYDKLCYLPVWSPDGRYIVFAEYEIARQMQLKAITVDGKPFAIPLVRFTQPGGRALSTAYRFLPDGKSLVILDGQTRKQQFSLVNLETGMRRPLTDLRPGRATRGFDVTPDGKRILFDRVQENSDIVLIDLPPRE